MKIQSFVFPALLSLFTQAVSAQSTAESYDVVIYGGTAAAVTAAVQVKQMGSSVVIISPDKHLGGLSSGGLGWTDSGNKAVIGGLSKEFYHRVWQHYQKPEAWVQQKPENYGNKGQGAKAKDDSARTMMIFEPHVAEQILDAWVKELDIPVLREALLDRAKGVAKSGDIINNITLLDGRSFKGQRFIDATYEGDLMAVAGISYHVGREANSVYGEEHNGVQTGVLHHRHHFGVFKEGMSPYVVPGDPSSGVLAGISTADPGKPGEGDKRVQAYCFRSCYTNDPSNRVPFPKPANYDAKNYDLLLRVLQAGWGEFFAKFDPLPNHKTDTNNHGPFSFDNIGANYDYPDASYERRRQIIQQHRDYQQGILWFVANDPRVPEAVRTELNTWGLPKDEFTDNGNWSHQLYIREARRMIGHFVMTENELRKLKPTPESIGMGSYTIDSHNVQRYITPEGFVQNEGDIGVSTNGPYAIAYGSLLPKATECGNLLVPVAMSASHIAYGSIRMEPVFMILGQSAATAAVLSLNKAISVQALPYAELQAQLLKDGQVLEYSSTKAATNTTLPGTVVDDSQATYSGEWALSSAGQSHGVGYRHDQNKDKGKTATFTTPLKAGRYEVRLAYSPRSNRATNVPVTVHHGAGTTELKINQQTEPDIAGGLVSLGSFNFGAEGTVTLGTADTDGHVIADLVQWLPVQ
jgi:FAD dependent oxidoreductase